MKKALRDIKLYDTVYGPGNVRRRVLKNLEKPWTEYLEHDEKEFLRYIAPEEIVSMALNGDPFEQIAEMMEQINKRGSAIEIHICSEDDF